MKIAEMNGEQKRAYWRLNKAAQYLRDAIRAQCTDEEYDRLYANLEIQQDECEALGCC